MPRLIITRPAEDGSQLAESLHDLGFETVLAPVFEIVPLPGLKLDLGGVQALLMTSANGVRAFAGRNPERNLKVFAVGDATARAAVDLGFADVESAGGDVDDLARLVAERARPSAGMLLHVAQSERAGDLSASLADTSFQVRREVLYEARPAENLPDDARAAIVASQCDGVLLYSPRSARLFEDLLARAGLSDAATGLDAFCLSNNVLKALKGPWRRRAVADKPSQESLLHLLATCYH